MKPTPPSMATANRSRTCMPLGSTATRSALASRAAPAMPTSLPTTSPTTTAITSGLRTSPPSASAPTGTPAANRANTGTARPADHGCNRCSSRSAGAAGS